MSEPLYLLDTNICIYLLSGNSLPAKRRFESCGPGQVTSSAMVFGEVMIGVENPAEAARALAFFDMVPVSPFDREAASLYASLPFKRQSFDRLLAAHALSLGLILVTNNEKHFQDIPGLRVENWTQ